MNKRIISICIFLTCISMTPLFSCRMVKNMEYKNLEDVKLEKFNLNNTVLRANLSCYNPNNFGIYLITSNFDIYINDKLCGNSIQTDKVKINKSSSFSAPIKIEMNLKKSIANLGPGLLNQEVKITIKGNVKAKKGFVVKNLPVSYTSNQRIIIL